MPEVSVVVAVFNCEAYVEGCRVTKMPELMAEVPEKGRGSA
jgi:hypothetical protein